MKRKLFLMAATIAFLVGFGALLHSPPSLVDAITGATPKARRAAAASAQLEGSYVFCVNTESDNFADENVRDVIIELVQEEADVDLSAEEIKFRLYVSENDLALVRYAKNLCERLAQAGVDVNLTEYSNTMLRSRAVSGKYDAFLSEKNVVDVTRLEQVDYIVMDSEEMR